LTISFRGELLLTRRLEVTSVQLGQREHGDHYRERVATEITRSLDIFDRQRLSVGWASWCSPAPAGPRARAISPQQALRAGRGGGIAAGHGFFRRRRADARGAVGIFLLVRSGAAVEEKAL